MPSAAIPAPTQQGLLLLAPGRGHPLGQLAPPELRRPRQLQVVPGGAQAGWRSGPRTASPRPPPCWPDARRILLQHLEDHLASCPGTARLSSDRPATAARSCTCMVQRGQVAGAAERDAAGQRLVGQHAQSVDVRPMVVGRAQERVRAPCIRACPTPCPRRRATRSLQAGDAEVHHLDRVCRRPRPSSITLSGFMSRWTMPFSCAASSALEIWRRIGSAALGRHRPFALEHLAEGLALQVLHHEEDPAVGDLAEVGDVADGLAADLRSGAGLVAQAIDGPAVLGDVAAQHLDGDALLQLHVLGGVDRAHAAGAQLGEHAVPRSRDDLPERQSQVRSHCHRRHGPACRPVSCRSCGRRLHGKTTFLVRSHRRPQQRKSGTAVSASVCWRCCLISWRRESTLESVIAAFGGIAWLGVVRVR